MANLTRKTSKSKSRSRRSANMKLRQSLNLVDCPNCHQKKLPHRICENCGYYAGRNVLNIEE